MNKCKECNTETKRPNFCCRKCNIQYYNKHDRKKRKSTGTAVCPSCKGKKDYQSNFCKKCFIEDTHKNVGKCKISRYFKKGNARIKYASIRDWARIIMNKHKVEKKCKICNFDIAVEVAHIKPISKFKETALMEEVNSMNNLIYLCPNHHTMFDMGLIKLPNGGE